MMWSLRVMHYSTLVPVLGILCTLLANSNAFYIPPPAPPPYGYEQVLVPFGPEPLLPLPGPLPVPILVPDYDVGCGYGCIYKREAGLRDENGDSEEAAKPEPIL